MIVTMDGDLQNDPGDIQQFLAKIDEGYDIVVGWPAAFAATRAEGRQSPDRGEAAHG